MATGRFTLSLDFGATAFQGDARWLEIQVRPGASGGAYTALSPRQDDLSLTDRRAYLRNVLPLTHGQSQFLIYVHEWPHRWGDRLIQALFHYGPMQPGEIEADFSPHFRVERIMARSSGKGYLAGEAAYLMRRREAQWRDGIPSLIRLVSASNQLPPSSSGYDMSRIR